MLCFNPKFDHLSGWNSNLLDSTVIWTSATLCVGSPYDFFRAKLRIRQPEVENVITSKQLKVET